MYKLGGLVHAPMNCTTFLCLTFLIIKTSCANSFYMSEFIHSGLRTLIATSWLQYVPLYISPYEPNATLFSNVNYLTSISRTSVPSLGIVTKSNSHLIPVSSCSPIGDKEWWFGQDYFSILKTSFFDAVLNCSISSYGHPSQQRHLRCNHPLWKRHVLLGCWAQSQKASKSTDSGVLACHLMEMWFHAWAENIVH